MLQHRRGISEHEIVVVSSLSLFEIFRLQRALREIGYVSKSFWICLAKMLRMRCPMQLSITSAYK